MGINLIEGKSYRYTNTVRIGRVCKKIKKSLDVVYSHNEDNKAVFITPHGTELLVHLNDVNELIKEVQ